MGETPDPDPAPERDEVPDHDRVEARAGDRLPDEATTDDPEAQAAAILADSDDRERHTGRPDDPPGRGSGAGGTIEHRRSEQTAPE